MKQTNVLFLSLAGLVALTAVAWLYPRFSIPAHLPQATPIRATVTAPARIVFLDSYNQGYAWSDGILRGVRRQLADRDDIELATIHMDTKRHANLADRELAAVRARAEIERLQPDVVISCDDNAFSLVIQEYYRDADLPVVFCGLNWDASGYGAPYSNTTGMLEVSLTDQLITLLESYADGSRVGYLSADTVTERKNLEYYEKMLKLDFDKVSFVSTMDDWETAFIEMQDEVDLMVFENNAGIQGWDQARAVQVVEGHVRIPVGTTNEWVMDTAMIGLTKIPDEQGEWSAVQALSILAGQSPQSIPVATNQKGRIDVNVAIADLLDVALRPELLRNAVIIGAE